MCEKQQQLSAIHSLHQELSLPSFLFFQQLINTCETTANLLMTTSLFIYTFNCAKESQIPPNDSFLSHLSSDPDVLPSIKPDLLVFNFQELLGLYESFYPTRVQTYLFQLSELLKIVIVDHYRLSNDEVGLVGIHHLYSLGMLVLTTQKDQFESFQVDSVSFGMFHSSLKGCLLSQLNFNNQSFAFLNCHLAANEGKFEDRKANLDKVYKFFNEDLNRSGHVFIAGDMNFRCDNYIINKGLENLRYDEFQRYSKHPLLKQFQETEITFLQSFKYLVNNPSSELNFKRNPSWCDRILHLKNYNVTSSIAVHKYNSIMECTSSDHKPVYLQVSVPERYVETTISEESTKISTLEQQMDSALTTMADLTIWFGLLVVFSRVGQTVVTVGLMYLVYRLFY